MAKTVTHYTGVAKANIYVYPGTDGSQSGKQVAKGTTLHLSVDANGKIRYENGLARTHSPVDGWVNAINLSNIEPAYDVTIDACTPPSSVILNTVTMRLNISGGKGGDMNAMTGYQIQYRERNANGLQYTPWSGSQTVASNGKAAVNVTASAGKVRQYRVRTTGKAGTEYYSLWVVCSAEVYSSATEKEPEKSGIITLHVFDSELNYKGRVENWISLTWEEEYQGEGAFTLAVPDTDRYAKLLQRGCFIYRNDRTTCMMVVNVERNGEHNNINIGGYTALHMLGYRMVYDKHTITNIEKGIYNMVKSNLRGLPITCANESGYKDKVEEEEFDCPMMLDAVLTLIREGDLGIRTVFDPNNREILFEVYQGTDRTYGSEDAHVFSTEFGNLYSIVVTEDDDVLKNVAVVTCTNPGADKTTFTYEAQKGLTGLERRELLVSGEPQGTTGEEDEEGNPIERPYAEWEKAMLDKGKQALTEHNLIQTFEVKPYTGTYGNRYTLGDKVTCKSSRYGLRFDARITQVKERYDERGSELTMTLGEPTINYIQKELKTHG